MRQKIGIVLVVIGLLLLALYGIALITNHSSGSPTLSFLLIIIGGFLINKKKSAKR